MRIHNLRKTKIEDLIGTIRTKKIGFKSTWNPFQKTYRASDIDSLLYEFRGKEVELFQKLEEKFGVEQKEGQNVAMTKEERRIHDLRKAKLERIFERDTKCG